MSIENWVKVQFYGKLPPGQALIDVDMPKIAQSLGKVFGFPYLDGITIVRDNSDHIQPIPSMIDNTPAPPPYFETQPWEENNMTIKNLWHTGKTDDQGVRIYDNDTATLVGGIVKREHANEIVMAHNALVTEERLPQLRDLSFKKYTFEVLYRTDMTDDQTYIDEVEATSWGSDSTSYMIEFYDGTDGGVVVFAISKHIVLSIRRGDELVIEEVPDDSAS